MYYVIYGQSSFSGQFPRLSPYGRESTKNAALDLYKDAIIHGRADVVGLVKIKPVTGTCKILQWSGPFPKKSTVKNIKEMFTVGSIGPSKREGITEPCEF